MANELPNLGANIVLEFQQSLNNLMLFGEALEKLDDKFLSMERRIDAMRASMSSLSAEVSKGTGQNLRRNIEREINNLIEANGIAVAQYGGKALNINARTVQNIFSKVDKALNEKLAQAYANIVIDINPDLQVGKVPISKDDLDEVNKAIARLVRVQLNNLVAALNKHGAGLISAQDLASLQFHIGKDTVQQIINRVKEHVKKIMLNPNVASGGEFEITERDMNRVFNSIKNRVTEAINNAISQVRTSHDSTRIPSIEGIQDAVNDAAQRYIREVSAGIRSMSQSVFERPLNQVSTQLRRFMARELGVDLDSFNRIFANHRFTSGELYSAELRRQFSRLEQALNRKIGGGLNEEVRRMVNAIESVQIRYSPSLGYHLIREIERINNQIVKKIREQIDIQFAHMKAEIAGVQVSPKDINRVRRIRQMGQVEVEGGTVRERRTSAATSTLVNDPYARRDNYFNQFGIQGAIVNTVRHILAGSIVGTPLMLLYRAFEQYRTSQLEQLKMFSNIYAKAQADFAQRAAVGDRRTASEVATQTIQDIMPFVREAAVAYAMDYGTMSAVASVGSRLLDDAASVKMFTDLVGKIYSIDREGDPVESIASGLEAFMGQFDLHIGELERRVVAPLAVATNMTNATTEAIMNAMMRSGSSFKAAGVSPEEAIAMIATSIQYTGLSGENIGNFYKSILPRLQSPKALSQLETLGVDVYIEEDGIKRVRSAMEIMKDVADLYDRIDDENARNTIMALFGTYQSAKGTTTLDELYTAVELAKAIENFNLEDLDDLLSNNLTTPIMELERAGTSTVLALTSVMEELTPVITDVSRAITNLTGGIRENSDKIADLIQFLGNALIGFASVYGMRAVYRSNAVQAPMARVAMLDALYGNLGMFGRGATQGTLQALADLPTVNQALLANTKENRAFMSKALTDPVIAPVIKDFTNNSDERMKELRNYIRDNNIVVNDVKDLLYAVEESRGYRAREEMTDERRWGGAQYAAGKLYDKGMRGIDENFAKTLAVELQDRARFDEISKSDKGMRVTTFLAGLGDQDLPEFRKHLEEIHRNTGKVINDFDSLAEAVDSYTAAQVKNREEVRKTNPHFVAIGNSVDKLARTLNSPSLAKGLNNLDTILGRISQKARGFGSVMAGLARSAASFGTQMLLFAGVGEMITNFGSGGIYTNAQKNLRDSEKLMQDINETMNWIKQGWFGAEVTYTARAFLSLWDAIWTPGKDAHTDALEMSAVLNAMRDYLNENYDANLPVSATVSPSDTRSNIKNFIEARGLDLEEVFNEFINSSGAQEKLSKSRAQVYRENMEKAMQEEEELRAIQERMNQTIADRMREAMLKGTYKVFDLDTLRQEADREVSRIEAESTLEQLRAISEGYATDSEEYVNIRRREAEEMKAVYDGILEGISNYIENAKATLHMMISDGGYTEEQINEQREEIARWERNLKEAQLEFETKARQIEQQMVQLTFDATLSRIQRAARIAEDSLAIQSAINELTMDRGSKEYIDAAIGISNERINTWMTQIEQLRSTPVTEDQRQQIDEQIAQLQLQIERERVAIRDLRLSRVTTYRQDLEDRLAEMSNSYLQERVNMGVMGLDENNPALRSLRLKQYNEQITMFDSLVSELKDRLGRTSDVEEQKLIQREIRDLQRQSLQAQLGILEEMRNTGGTFNLPDNVKAMSYYEYITRNNTHTTYTVQGGDVHVTISLPNVTGNTPTERIREIGRAIGQGLSDGRSLRLQKQANPFGYRDF